MGEKRIFKRYIGIDYAGGDTPKKKMRTLAFYCAEEDNKPVKVDSGKHPKGYWSREDIAERLVEELQKSGKPTLVGIDHAFGFPIRYFHRYPHLLGGNWDRFLEDFQRCWRTDEDGAVVRAMYDDQMDRMVQGKLAGCRFGRSDWFRLTDPVKPPAKSVFNFMTRGPVAFSTFAGMPWLLRIRRELRRVEPKVHFWPFDGWKICEGRSAVVEVYPALWQKLYEKEVEDTGMTKDQRDAYRVARWMSNQDQRHELSRFLDPERFECPLDRTDRETGEIEGWILGVTKPRPAYRR